MGRGDNMNINNFTLEIISGGIIAIFGIFIGSLLTYFTETFRKNKEDKKIILKNIYLKIYTEIKYFFLTQNAFRKGHDVKNIISLKELNEIMENLLKENIGIIDNRLFNFYHKLKSEKYFEDFSGGANDYKYLAFYGELLNNMLKLDKSTKMLNKYFKNDVKTLYYKYVVWFGLMNRLKDWEKVEDILNKDFHFKKTYKTIANSIFIKNISSNNLINTEEYSRIFIDYCRNEIIFPIFHKYFWEKK